MNEIYKDKKEQEKIYKKYTKQIETNIQTFKQLNKIARKVLKKE